MSHSGRKLFVALGALCLTVGVLMLAIISGRTDTRHLGQDATHEAASPLNNETKVLSSQPVLEELASIEEQEALSGINSISEPTSSQNSFVSSKAPYYWEAFSSMRSPEVSDPNSEQNQATLRRLREMRRANLSNEE